MRVAFSFSSKDRADFSRRSLTTVLADRGFDLIWVDGSSTEEGRKLPREASAHQPRWVEIHEGVIGGPDRAIQFGLKRLLELGYDHVGLIENDLEFSPGWFGVLMGLFQKCENLGGATVRTLDSRTLSLHEGYARMWNLGAGMALFTRLGAQAVLDHYRVTTAREIHSFYRDRFNTDIGGNWELFMDQPDRGLGADWNFARSLHEAGLEVAGSIPSYAFNFDCDLERTFATRYL